MSVVQFIPRATKRPHFRNIAEAMTWFRVMGFRELAPPIDATGDEQVDAYMATVFGAIVHWRHATTVLAHLLAKAEDEDRAAVRLIAVGEIAAARFNIAVAAILRKWATEFAAAMTDAPFGGSAA